MNFRIMKKNQPADQVKRASHEIDFEALWPRSGHAGSVGVKSSHNDENKPFNVKHRVQRFRN